MAFITASSQLSQGTSTAETITFTASGSQQTMDGTGLPVVANGDYFELRDCVDAVNNGLYQVTSFTGTTQRVCEKISGSNPVTASSEPVTWLGDTADKNVFFDTAARKIYLLEQAALDVLGLGLDTFYKFTKEEWKDDDYLNAFPFPFFAIDTDAGKYIIGTDGANTNGWNWQDVVSPAIRTRKLIRAAGWEEQDALGSVLAQWAGIITLGTFAAPTDNAYYKFGTDTTVDNTVDFDFADAVNEPIKCFELIGDLTGDTPAFATTSTFTRATGSFITDGFVVGGSIEITGSTSNNGTYELLVVSATSMTITTTWTAEAIGTTQIAVDNRSAFSLAIREQGKTHGASNLAAAGESALGNRLFKFPLSNVTDLKVVNADVIIDPNSDGSAADSTFNTNVFAGMAITYYNAVQPIAGYVGGSYNFGIQIEANGGSAQEVYEFVQWSLRSTGGFGTGDIDSDGDVAIGRAMDDLLVFEGDTLIAGKGIPSNPEAGGSGVYISNINANDANNIVNYDNLGIARTFPESIAVTLDFNDAILNDSVAAYDLYFDRTVRTTTDATFVITAGTGANGTFVSTGQMPALFSGAGQYVRIVGLTGVDAAMNGVYQVTTESSTSLWNVTRWDGATIVTTTGAVANIDQYAIDTPDAVIVQDSGASPVQGVDPSTDVSFSFSYDGNDQFGRTNETTFVVARAVGLSTAQFVQSSVQAIVSGSPLTIVLSASNELNVAA